MIDGPGPPTTSRVSGCGTPSWRAVRVRVSGTVTGIRETQRLLFFGPSPGPDAARGYPNTTARMSPLAPSTYGQPDGDGSEKPVRAHAGSTSRRTSYAQPPRLAGLAGGAGGERAR